MKLRAVCPRGSTIGPKVTRKVLRAIEVKGHGQVWNDGDEWMTRDYRRVFRFGHVNVNSYAWGDDGYGWFITSGCRVWRSFTAMLEHYGPEWGKEYGYSEATRNRYRLEARRIARLLERWALRMGVRLIDHERDLARRRKERNHEQQYKRSPRYAKAKSRQVEQRA